MPFSTFPLFQSHIDLAHDYWSRLISKGDHVIDATAGNGHDSLKLASLVLTEDSGFLWALDIQQQALEKTREQLTKNSIPLHNTSLINQSHATFPSSISPESIKLIVYNLGYLPGGDKAITTQTSSTIDSLDNARALIMKGGAISITCYPGHAEGAREQQQILEYLSDWPPYIWNCTIHQWPNRKLSPSLILIQNRV